MSFERTAGSIANLSGVEKIGLDSMLEMIVCVIQDVREHNGVVNLQELGVSEPDLFIKKAYNLMQALLPICKGNQEGLSELSSIWQERYKQAVADLDDIMLEFSGVAADMEKTEALHLELEKKQIMLREEKAHLINVVGECEKFREEIAALSDVKLEEMAAEREQLEEVVRIRREKKEEIVKGKEALQKELNTVESEFGNLNTSVESMKKTIASLIEQKDIASKEAHIFEKEIEALKKKLEDYKVWTTKFPEMRDVINEQIAELDSRYAILVNVWNSAKSDDFLMETLYKIPNSETKLVIGSYPDLNVAGGKLSDVTELTSWFEGIHGRINGLLALHEQMIKCLATQAEQITANSEK